MRFSFLAAPLVLAAVVFASSEEQYYRAKHDGKYYKSEAHARQAFAQRCRELGGTYGHGGSVHKLLWNTLFRITANSNPVCSSWYGKDMTKEVCKSLGWEELKHDSHSYQHEPKEPKRDDMYSVDYKHDEPKHSEPKDAKDAAYSGKDGSVQDGESTESEDGDESDDDDDEEEEATESEAKEEYDQSKASQDAGYKHAQGSYKGHY